MDDEMICLWREAFKISQLFVPGKYFNIWSGKYFLERNLETHNNTPLGSMAPLLEMC